MIQKERIKLLPNWCITDKFPAFYDTDSANAIEQTAKIYGAMRELQIDYNNFVNEINTCITDFINNVNADQEEFENNINKIVHDYIAMIDEKIKMQDSVITEAVQYMKDHLVTTIKDLNKDNELDHMIVEAISNVENELKVAQNNFETEASNKQNNFEANISNKQNEFETKVNSQIQSLSDIGPLVANSVEEMTDTSKAYVNTTDGHWYYYNGTSWEDGGIYQGIELNSNSVSYNKFNDSLKKKIYRKFMQDTLIYPTNSGFVRNDGTTEASTEFSYYEIDVLPGEEYYIQTVVRSNAYPCVIVDSEGSVVSLIPTTEASNKLYKEYVTIPQGASKMYINVKLSEQYYCFFAKVKEVAYLPIKTLKDNFVAGFVTGSVVSLASAGDIIREYNAMTKSIVNFELIECEKGNYIKSAYKFTVAKYDSEENFIERTGLVSEYLVTEDNYKYRFSIFNKGDVVLFAETNAIINEQVNNLIDGFKIFKKYPAINNLNKILHISFDDTYLCLKDINDNSYESIFENSFLNDLKELHDLYGCVFTLNLFNSYSTDSSYDLTQITNAYKNEFQANSDWLKFSFHAGSDTTRYDETSGTVQTDYYNCIQSIIKFAGYNAIDNFIRLGFFTGNEETINTLNESTFKPLGYFTADDSRNSYYLDTEKTNFINNNNYGYDENKNIFFLKSCSRLESASTGDYSTYIQRNLDKQYIEVFTHEYAWNDTIKAVLKSIIEQAISYNYKFDYFSNYFNRINKI